jgi:hypothetical protein
MRVRTLLAILLAVNALWAAAFFGYVHRSTDPVIPPVRAAVSTSDSNTAPAASNVLVSSKATSSVVTAAATNAVLASATNQVAAASPRPRSLPSTDKQFGWQDITNDTYLDYIANLRAAGCPEKQIRNIVVSDVNDLFDKRRLEHAIKTDSQWWKPETFSGILPMQNFSTANFDEERRALLTKFLGENWDEFIKLPSLNGTAVNLTGPVLGALPADTWNSVQEICQRSIERHQAHINARMNEGIAMDSLEMAKMREMTRSDLTKVLTPEQLEEFLLRYSHNSSKLRMEMRGLDLTPEEFRKVFRAIDPIEHQVQLEYGGPEALSQKQREQMDAQRDRAIREALSPQRYQQYLATKDPLYRQAQMLAAQYGLNGKAVQPIYEMQKVLETRRTEVTQNNSLTPEQRAQALQTIGIEQQQQLQRILINGQYRQ